MIIDQQQSQTNKISDYRPTTITILQNPERIIKFQKLWQAHFHKSTFSIFLP